MMIRKIVTSLAAVGLFALAQKAPAQTNLFPATFNAVCTSSNSSGLLKEIVTGTNLIDNCAVENNLTNLNNLKLVFNPTNFSLQVIDTNGAPLCTSLTFPGGLTFTNTPTNIIHTASNTTEIVFQRDVLVETNVTPSGVISGSATWNGTNMSAFRLNALLLYTEPVPGTNTPEICRASLRVGVPHEGGDDGDNDSGDGNRGTNTNHLGWQNPHNPHSH